MKKSYRNNREQEKEVEPEWPDEDGAWHSDEQIKRWEESGGIKRIKNV